MLNTVFTRFIECIQEYFTNGINETVNAFYNNNIVYFIISIVCLLLLIEHRKTLKSGYRLLSSSSLFLLFVILLIPLFTTWTIKLPFVDSAVISRFWIIIPIWLIITYVLTSFLSQISNKTLKTAAILIITLTLVFSGHNSINMVFDQTPIHAYNEPSSIYKIRRESVDIADALLRLSNEPSTSVFLFLPEEDIGPSEGGNYVEGGSVFSGITQYSGKLYVRCLFYNETEWNSYLYDNAELENNDIYNTITILQNYHYSFFVIPNNDTSNNRIDSLGYCLAEQIDGYNIYRVR